ncbi:MAG: riboflavin biosynthesis protein RibF [Rhodospirillaceae bacterium]|nr:riboflavin biosynthesis protein RibF [Rhodospirillaceae bacterium]OUT80921.1 MAG: riboflavin biosynthesis protein RibF [Rhodospirillaceae bacterium TMED23]
MCMQFSVIMRIFKDYKYLTDTYRNSSIAIGNFDGLHLGHREVIRRAGIFARERGVPWGVLTFEPHPRTLFNKTQTPFRLSSANNKEQNIKKMGVDFLVVINFDEEFSKVTGQQFVEEILVQSFEASYVVSGDDFAFGHKRSGNINFLHKMGKLYGFGTVGIKHIVDKDNKIISSTRIRDFIRKGDIKAARNLLGKCHEIEGEVIKGDQRGRKIGFPTANIKLGDSLNPAKGVYAVRVRISNEVGSIWHNGIANFGVRPTFNGDTPLLEVHIFDYTGDLYATSIRVTLIDYIRPEKAFNEISDLILQIKKDCVKARSILVREIT